MTPDLLNANPTPLGRTMGMRVTAAGAKAGSVLVATAPPLHMGGQTQV